MAKLKGTPRSGLFAATLGFFTGFAAVALFGPTAARFNEVMGLTPVTIGFLVAIPSLSGSLLRIPFGAWVDTSGGRKPFLVLLWLSLLGMLGLTLVVYRLYPQGMSTSLYPWLLLLGVLCGCGIATFSVGVGQVSYWFPQHKQGAALGSYAGLGNLAPGIFSLLLPLALSAWGLKGVYLAWLLFLLAGVIIYTLTGANACYFQLVGRGADAEAARNEARLMGQELFPKGNARQSLAAAARNWKTWMLVAVYFTTFGGFIAMTAWLPTYWKGLYAAAPLAAGGLTAAFSLTASLLRVAGGSISDRMSGEKTAMLSLLTLLGGAVLMCLSTSFGLSLAAELVMALGMGVANAAVFKLMPQYVPQAVGGAAGWIGGLGAFGGFAIPPVMGVFVRFYGEPGYAWGFLTFVLLAVLSLCLAYALQRAHAAQRRAESLSGALS